ncbi:abortive infection Abi-like protein [Micrococcus sp. 140720015-1]|uniref:abortive infection family protein n=1 Tax=Micrococcus luteus TaxID=1270 RepID=UPI001C89E438|nr:abortive infection family protein [Micrococcus luteus]MCV7593622.1 abortive infection family protein [Micrococcus luteus]
MNTPWAADVALSLSRLMEETWYPSHGGLDTIFGKLAIDSPEIDRQGSSINKVKRLRRAFDQANARGEQAAINLVKEIIEEMRFKRVFSSSDEQTQELIGALRVSLARAGALLADDGSLEPLVIGPAIEAGGRETVGRLQGRLRDPSLDPGAILGTSKDLMEATAKHLLKECSPGVPARDMPAVVSQAMRAAGLSTIPSEIDSTNAKAVAALRQQVIRTAEAVTSTRNTGGDGHGHLEPTDVSKELADYIRHLTLAAVAYLLSEAEKTARSA